MNKFKLIWLACPALLASMLIGANPLHAGGVVPKSVNVEFNPAKPLFEVVFEQETPESPMLKFTESESNAVQRFGCDCSSCLNAGRQLQGKLPLV